jgi:hypothetical protein
MDMAIDIYEVERVREIYKQLDSRGGQVGGVLDIYMGHQ